MKWRHERVAWLASHGRDQWSIPLPRSAVAATVLSGQTWMVWESEEHVATITLTAYTYLDELWKPDRDPEALWHTDDDPADALYAAKMIVPGIRSGKGLGAEMLRWAAGRAYDAGLTWLRLDAWTTNPELHDYYDGWDSSTFAPSRPASQVPASNVRPSRTSTATSRQKNETADHRPCVRRRSTAGRHPVNAESPR